MNGEHDQRRLQRQMAPQLQPETFVYCTFPDNQLPVGLDPMCTFREAEGLTAIIERSQALRADIPHVFESRLITLTVHSSLNAVGFLALVSNCLAQAGISCNAVAAYHHDHLFIPSERAEEALVLLRQLSLQSEPQSV